MRKYSLEQIAIALIIILGVITSLIQFLYNRSLHFDEAALALNIIHRNSYDLLKPLDYGQVAPILFLQIEKLFSTIWPNSEYGLRLFPLLCFWASVLLFYQLIKKQLDSRYARIVALSLFAFGPMFIYYSSEVKQYMSDVFVLLCTFYFLSKDFKREKNKYLLLGIIGVTAIFLSNVAPIILFTSGLYLSYEYFYNKTKKITPLMIVFGSWSIAFLLYYYAFIYGHPLQQAMIKFWSHSNAFSPFNPFEANFYVFLTKTLPMRIFNSLFFIDYEQNVWVRRFVVYGMVFMFTVGVIKLIRNRQIKLIIFICTPILLHLFLSALQLYPYERRLILYTLPGTIIICSIGFDYTVNFILHKLKTERIKQYCVILLLFFSLLFLFRNFPFKGSEIKECITYIQNKARNTNIYICFGYEAPFKYYNDIGFVNQQLKIVNKNIDWLKTGTEYVLSHPSENFAFYEIDVLKMLHGEKWLLLHNNYENDITGVLDSLGHRQIESFKTKGASAYLYDFGEGE